MNDSVKLLVVLMVFWAMIVVIFNLLGQAMAMPDDGESSIAAGSTLQTADVNAPEHLNAFGYQARDHAPGFCPSRK